jgi:hypothetical protein
MPVQPSVPLLMLQAGSVVAGDTTGPTAPVAEAYRPLVDYLARFYPADHVVVHLANSADPAADALSAAPLSAFESLVARLGPASTLFVDRLRQPAG